MICWGPIRIILKTEQQPMCSCNIKTSILRAYLDVFAKIAHIDGRLCPARLKPLVRLRLLSAGARKVACKGFAIHGQKAHAATD